MSVEEKLDELIERVDNQFFHFPAYMHGEACQGFTICRREAQRFLDSILRDLKEIKEVINIE